MLSMRDSPPVVRPWTPTTTEPACRLCGAPVHRMLIDLGRLPVANHTITATSSDAPAYSLHVRVCDTCTLVQITDPVPPGASIATEQAQPAASLTPAGYHAEMMAKRLRLTADSLVIEIGARNVTLLRPFQAPGMPVSETTRVQNSSAGLPAETAFFNTGTAMDIAVRFGCADLVVATNVLPLVPDLFDFAASLASILRPNGVTILQVPHLLALVQGLQFDAFRHDAYTYLSLRVLEHVLRAVGLRVFDAERLPARGGELRIHACHSVGPHPARAGLKAVRQAERFAELDRRDFWSGFSDRVARVRTEIRDFLHPRRAAGRRVVAYGATSRGIMLLNYCGITTDQIACVADPDPARQGRLLPGSRIPIVPLEALMARPPDDIVILPWPHAAEIALELARLRQRGTQLWTPVPRIVRV